MLQREDFADQNIELPFGLSASEWDRSASANKMFPDDMTGKTVLIVGCKYSYFYFDALRRGASRVVGLDLDQDSLRKARMLAEYSGVATRFENFNIETDEITETFDFVLCLNVLQHLRNPISVLDKLIAHTQERLVLEVATFGAHDAKKFRKLTGLRWLLSTLLERLPIIVLGAGGNKPMTQRFFLSPRCVESLLLDQRGSFAKLETKPSEKKGRFMHIAEKWQVDRMVLIAGPTSSGKSTLIRRVREGELTKVAETLGIEQPGAWAVSGAGKLPNLGGPKVERLIYHYDFLRPFLRGPNDHQSDSALDILRLVKDLTTVTLWTPPESLSRQHQESEIDRRIKNGRYRGKKRRLKIAELYLQREQVSQLYNNWFNYISDLPGRHLVLTLGEEPEFIELSRWKSEQL